MKFIEVKVSYSKEMEYGKKKVIEKYLVDAMSFAEAEARIIEKVDASSLEEFSVEAVRRSGYEDELLTGCDTDKFYKVKVIYLTVDEKTHIPTRTKVYYLVQASSIATAVSSAQKLLTNSVYDTTITEVSETEIKDIVMEEK